jgi:glycosyltransferase involved in cell wall biosynthesis
MKALLLHHPYDRPRFEQDFLDRLAELPELDVEPADLAALAEGRIRGGGRKFDLASYDAVVLFVAFSRLRQAPPLDWERFAGLRVLLEHDAIQNYSDIFDPTLRGTWPPVFRRHRFDRMVTSSRAVRDLLRDEGVDAAWVAKAFEPRRFADRDGERSGIVTYGSEYRCRVVAERAIVESGLPLRRLPMTPYPELGGVLARHLACLAISSDLLTPPALRAGLDGVPPREVAMRPGLEPMAKFFEGAGAGCCPVADAMEDLAALGFRDGENAITFRTHDELVERLRWWLARPGDLRGLGRAAARLALDRHTWAHRAAELREVLTRHRMT